MTKPKNKIAQALGRMAAGVKKTKSKAFLAAVRKNLVNARAKRARKEV